MWKSALMLSVAAVVLHIEAAEAKNVMVAFAVTNGASTASRGFVQCRRVNFIKRAMSTVVAKTVKEGPAVYRAKGTPRRVIASGAYQLRV
jgi:hypothetical protein